jgi:hypothetical protein
LPPQAEKTYPLIIYHLPLLDRVLALVPAVLSCYPIAD